MTDLEIAKNELYEEDLTLAIVKDGSLLYSTKDHRISGFLEAIERCGEKLDGASVADRVVGKAVALICAYAKIKGVYAVVLSRQAMAILKQNKIVFDWKELVDNILDSGKVGTCPFEKTAAEIVDPQTAYTTLRKLRATLKSCKP